MTLAHLCHWYPGYTLDLLRDLTVLELDVLVQAYNEANES